jgi:hypothetical protein
MSAQEPVKRRYQIFRKLAEKLSFDDIESDIQELSTPCSEVIELTDEEYRLLEEERRSPSDSRLWTIRVVPLDTWFTPAEIKAVIEKQKNEKDAAAKKLAETLAKKEAAKAKKAAAKLAFANQCSGANGKVK